MHKIRTFSMILAAFLTIGTGISAFSYTQGKDNSQLTKAPANASIKRINDGIFSNANELPNEQMTCYLTAATRTESSITVTAQFSIGSYTEWGDRNHSVFLVIDDPDYSGDRSDPSLSGETNPNFNGYTSTIDGTSSKFTDIFVIPEKMTYGSRFSVTNTLIKAGIVDFSTLTNVTVTRIVIPSTVTTIEAGAFVNVPDTVTISCVAASKPAGWDANWTDATNVEFGYNDASVLVSKNLVIATGTVVIDHSIEDSYILGYVNKEGGDFYNESFAKADLPLVVSYDLLSLDGTFATNVRAELPLLDVDSRNAPYDAVGDIGSASLSVTVDVFLEENQTLDFNSIKFSNIYKAKRDTALSTYCCDTSEIFYKDALKRFTNIIVLNDVVKCTFTGVSTFAGYTLVKMNVDKTTPYYYETIASSVIKENEDKLDSGAYRIRYAIYNLSNAAYRITYMDGNEQKTVKIDIKTPLPVIELKNDVGNEVSFMLKNSDVGPNFNANTLVQLEILDFVINMHLWNTDNNTIVGRTSRAVKFGIVDIMPESIGGAKKITNLNLALIIIYVIYIVVYAAGATLMFFFLKNKYKNDEFRRIKPKKYLKTALIGFFGAAEVLLAVVGLIYRTTIFKNTLSAFNPSDVLVVIAGIIALIIIGYFIKTLVVMFKTNKARKEIVRLKLNEIKE